MYDGGRSAEMDKADAMADATRASGPRKTYKTLKPERGKRRKEKGKKEVNGQRRSKGD